jgi:hypothetical protein
MKASEGSGHFPFKLAYNTTASEGSAIFLTKSAYDHQLPKEAYSPIQIYQKMKASEGSVP